MNAIELGGPAAATAFPLANPAAPSLPFGNGANPALRAAAELDRAPLPAEWPDFLWDIRRRQLWAERAARRRRPFDWAEEGL